MTDINKPEDARAKRERDLKKSEDHRKHYEDTVRRLRAQLDRTHLSSASRKPLEKAFQRLLSQGPAAFDEFNDDYDGNF
jgi:hypothetical protein